jgi:hypothetical protein
MFNVLEPNGIFNGQNAKFAAKFGPAQIRDIGEIGHRQPSYGYGGKSRRVAINGASGRLQDAPMRESRQITGREASDYRRPSPLWHPSKNMTLTHATYHVTCSQRSG